MNEDPGTERDRDAQLSHDHDIRYVPCSEGCPGYEAMLLEKRAAMATSSDPDRTFRPPQTQDPVTGQWVDVEPLGWQGWRGKTEGWLRDHPRIPGSLRVANFLAAWEERGLG